MGTRLVLSLFPGADLLGKAFEAHGFCVVRGPDTLWGGDIRDFHVPAGVFDGVIGGPPCQVFSLAVRTQTKAIDMIPEYLRIVEEARPRWAVMENVMPALHAPSAPAWPHVVLRDVDCGGKTCRKRAFWFYGVPPAPQPVKSGNGYKYAVLASNWKRRQHRAKSQHVQLTAEQAAEYQGFPELAEKLQERLTAGDLLSKRQAEILTVHLLGNGVPRAMGEYVARHVRNALEGRDSFEMTGLPLFAAGR
jgi:DNA (cytosine-5)-methyltransferase 1